MHSFSTETSFLPIHGPLKKGNGSEESGGNTTEDFEKRCKQNAFEKGTKKMPLKNGKTPRIIPKKSWKKGDSSLGSSKDKDVKKGHLKKQPLKKGKLCQRSLNKLPKMTLAEKMEVTAEEAEGDEDQAAENLKKSMTPAEKQSAWSKHQTHLKRNPKDAKALQKAGKNEKGLAGGKWLMQKDGKKFLTAAAKVAASQALKKTEEWMSEKATLKRWSPQELQAHLASGRVVWREDPYTPGVFEHQDTQNWSRERRRGPRSGRLGWTMSLKRGPGPISASLWQ